MVLNYSVLGDEKLRIIILMAACPGKNRLFFDGGGI
jgi:hypothetical protein